MNYFWHPAYLHCFTDRLCIYPYKKVSPICGDHILYKTLGHNVFLSQDQIIWAKNNWIKNLNTVNATTSTPILHTLLPLGCTMTVRVISVSFGGINPMVKHILSFAISTLFHLCFTLSSKNLLFKVFVILMPMEFYWKSV